MRVLKYIASFMLLLLGSVVCYAQPKPKNGGVVSEYLQFKAMADAAFDDGNFEKAQKLYNVCVEMVSGDDYATTKLKTCQNLNNSLKQIETAVKTNNQVQLETALNSIKNSKMYGSPNNLLKNRVLLLLEKEADQNLKNSDFENAVRIYARTHELLPASGLIFKIERANSMYVEKYGRKMVAYTDFQNKRRAKNQLTPVPSENEAEGFRKQADIYFAKGEWDKAQKLYNAALVVGEGKRPDIEQKLVDIARNKNLERQKEEADKQSNFGLAAKVGEEMLKARPGDAQLKSDIANNYEKLADKYYSESRFADAQNYYRKANETEANSALQAKIDDAETKIAETRVANEEKRQIDLKTPNPKKWYKGLVLIGGGIVTGVNYLQPTLTDGNTKVNSVSKLGWHGGLQAILLPKSTMSVIVGAIYNTNYFYIPNSAKTAKVEDFTFNTLQWTASLRLQKPLGDTDNKWFMMAGLGYNKLLKANYQNYLMDKNNANSFNNYMNYSIGLGMSKLIAQRQEVSLMISYDGGLQNVFASSFKDGSNNKNAPSLTLSNFKISLLFKVF